jgi:hypothetical protein
LLYSAPVWAGAGAGCACHFRPSIARHNGCSAEKDIDEYSDAAGKAALNVGSVVQIFALALVIAALSEWLGPLPIALGVGKVVLLPMIWALLIGLVLGLLRKRMPAPLQLSLHSQHLAAAFLSSRCSCSSPSWACWWVVRCRNWPRWAGVWCCRSWAIWWAALPGHAGGAAAGHQARSDWRDLLHRP